MTVELEVLTYVVFEVRGRRVEIGDPHAAQRVTVAGNHVDLEKSLATATTWDAWGFSTEDAITAFDVGVILSDQDVFAELTVDRGAEVGTVVSTVKVRANVPFVLGDDTAKANYTADFAAGTDDVIDRIRVRNESGSTANVRLVLVD